MLEFGPVDGAVTLDRRRAPPRSRIVHHGLHLVLVGEEDHLLRHVARDVQERLEIARAELDALSRGDGVVEVVLGHVEMPLGLGGGRAGVGVERHGEHAAGFEVALALRAVEVPARGEGRASLREGLLLVVAERLVELGREDGELLHHADARQELAEVHVAVPVAVDDAQDVLPAGRLDVEPQLGEEDRGAGLVHGLFGRLGDGLVVGGAEGGDDLGRDVRQEQAPEEGEELVDGQRAVAVLVDAAVVDHLHELLVVDLGSQGLGLPHDVPGELIQGDLSLALLVDDLEDALEALLLRLGQADLVVLSSEDACGQLGRAAKVAVKRRFQILAHDPRPLARQGPHPPGPVALVLHDHRHE
mmetsp:Transcript_58727/g.124688  ORF Transcript_58727/g.124688 Transcript_58727/m.124688 type:complete len:359 (-) Transcript_58727:908-1984(-)